MNIDYKEARGYILSYLDSKGIEATQSAFKPLSQIDFERLVDIYDHEEHFLRTKFLEYLNQIYQARLETKGGSQKINTKDVRAAMLMLGGAVANADEKQISRPNKSIIQIVCPYC